eukprot:CAMPEP_0204255526 /NCGR_PEP_ID=MMETSP0468-20130131/3272_1 /ASSEMBLY_ACC=CAM_ASM_000383 /TAXON_ID=2969 /ORGANISM="Oxyrrhis marina" /LENGTH=73 /DNA_ID=CAMNT_0051229417 /DNA_START=63 /DNA_END=284 /DNA_ORIENTATION=-
MHARGVCPTTHALHNSLSHTRFAPHPLTSKAAHSDSHSHSHNRSHSMVMAMVIDMAVAIVKAMATVLSGSSGM